MTISKMIAAELEGAPEGETLSAKELLHLGGRAAVDQALSRLVKRGLLIRVGRGLYTRPVRTRFGTRAPTVEAIVETIARKSGETITVNGAVEANKLGLTTQNSVRSIYLTSGTSREFNVGKKVVELKHVPMWQLYSPKSRAGSAVRALAWFGKPNASETLQVLRGSLSGVEKEELLALRAQVPGWMASELSKLSSHA